MTEVILPHNNFMFRWYQAELQEFLLNKPNNEPRFAYCNWHRKAGKDEVMMHLLLQAALTRPGSYVHLFQFSQEVRESLWDNINPHTGNNRIDDVFPKELILKKNNTKMQITVPSVGGKTSTITFAGYDNYDNKVGSLPTGIVMSEFAVHDVADQAFKAFKPQIEMANGFIVLVSTPRGRNHGYRRWQAIQDDKYWFKSSVGVDVSGVYTEQQIARIKQEAIKDYGTKAGTAYFNQEYMVDFLQEVSGSFYGELIAAAREEGRIVPDFKSHNLYSSIINDSSLHTYVAFDIGVNDPTSMWIAKVKNKNVFIYKHYENHGYTADHYLQWLKTQGFNRKNITLILPHDVKVREWISGSRIETIKSLGYNARIVPKHSVDDGVHITKKFFSNCYFDEGECYNGIEALEAYCLEFNEKKGVHSLIPGPEWARHPSDAFRYLAVDLTNNVL